MKRLAILLFAGMLLVPFTYGMAQDSSTAQKSDTTKTTKKAKKSKKSKKDKKDAKANSGM